MTKKVALVTGASAGLGVEFARQLSAKGHHLVLVARRKDRLQALAAELGNSRAISLDLSASDAAPRLMADIASQGDTVDMLVNNAGFGMMGRFAELDARRQREMIDLNCGALTELCSAVVPVMISRRSGSILNVASTAAFQPGPGMAVYFATKAFVLSFTEALHEEVKRHGVKVSALCPGPTLTEFGEVAGLKNNLTKYSPNAKAVVAAGIEGLERNQAVVIPGVMNKATAQAHRFVSRGAIRRAASRIKL